MKVVSDNLRVRSAPRVADDSIKLEPLLKTGDRLFVVGGPVVADDYEWYEVASVNIDGERTWFTLPSGWIARGDHDGTPWVAVDAPRCPAEPVDIDALAAMHALERLACFGNRPVAFRAVIDGGGSIVACDVAAGQGPCAAGPDWLAGNGGWTALTSLDRDTGSPTSGPALTLDPSGSVQASALPEGRVVAVEGAFDHPASASCYARPRARRRRRPDARRGQAPVPDPVRGQQCCPGPEFARARHGRRHRVEQRARPVAAGRLGRVRTVDATAQDRDPRVRARRPGHRVGLRLVRGRRPIRDRGSRADGRLGLGRGQGR